MELESLKSKVGSSTDSEGRTIEVKVMSAILVPIFGQVGEIKHKGILKDTVVRYVNGKPVIETVAVNKGNGRLLLTARYEVLDAGGNVAAKGGMGRAYLLVGTERVFRVELKAELPPGTYRLRMTCVAPQLKKPLKSQVTFELKPPPAPAQDAAAARHVPGRS